MTFLFGLGPALRASSVKPASALKGGEDPHSRRRLTHALIAAQVAFCFLVLFVAGLFVATFERLSHRPIGFSADRILLLYTVPAHAQQPSSTGTKSPIVCARSRASKRLRCRDGNSLQAGYQSNNFLSIHGELPSGPLCFLLSVSPGWLEALKIPSSGRPRFCRPDDVDPSVVIVNETFVKTYFNGENPVGKSFYRTYPRRIPATIIGLVRDSRYSDIRETQKPVAYLPFNKNDVPRANHNPSLTRALSCAPPDRILLHLHPCCDAKSRGFDPNFA